MQTALSDLDGFIHNPVDESVLIADPSRPKPRPSVLEGFGIAIPFVRVARNFLDERIDLRHRLFVDALPIKIVLPSFWREHDIHILTSIPFPAFKDLIALSIRAAFLGLRIKYIVSSIEL